jgi:hypothetical integral membrane protein (TIGR02206 family)
VAPEHLATMAVVAIAIAALVIAARTWPGPWTGAACRALAVVLVVSELAWWVWVGAHNALSIQFSLPLQLCDLAGFVAAFALWFRTPFLVELTYFWGIAGTLNSIVTPDVSDHFPSFSFLQYYASHAAIVAAAFFLVAGLRMVPRPWAAARVYALTAGLLAVDAVVDAATGANYLYLRHVPGGHTLLDVMGPWPWYIATGAVLAAVFFGLLEAPFRISGRARARSRTAPYQPPASPPSHRLRRGR